MTPWTCAQAAVDHGYTSGRLDAAHLARRRQEREVTGRESQHCPNSPFTTAVLCRTGNFQGRLEPSFKGWLINVVLICMLHNTEWGNPQNLCEPPTSAGQDNAVIYP